MNYQNRTVLPSRIAANVKPSSSAYTVISTGPFEHVRHNQPHSASSGTPSLVSGTSLSTVDSPLSSLPSREHKSNLAWHVKSNAGSPQRYKTVDTSTQTTYEEDPFPTAIFGMTLPGSGPRSLSVKAQSTETAPEARSISSGNFYRAAQLQEVGQETSATSPSRYTESPFSVFSGVTSTSSISPVRNKQTRWTAQTVGHGQADDARSAANIAAAASSNSERRVSTTKYASSDLPYPFKPHKKISTIGNGESMRAPISTIPPELAHLNVDAPLYPKLGERQPPRRPSREGIPDLTDHKANRSIVQSDIPARPQKPSLSSTRQSTRHRGLFGFSSRSASEVDQHSAPTTENIVSSKGNDHRTAETGDETSHEPSQSPKARMPRRSSERFGFLHRRSKDPGTIPQRPGSARERGPTAGTGHEGYFKSGLRSRSFSFRGDRSRQPPNNDVIPHKDPRTNHIHPSIRKEIVERGHGLESEQVNETRDEVPNAIARSTSNVREAAGVLSGERDVARKISKESIEHGTIEAQAEEVAHATQGERSTSIRPKDSVRLLRKHSMMAWSGDAFPQEGSRGHILRSEKHHPGYRKPVPLNFAQRLQEPSVHDRVHPSDHHAEHSHVERARLEQGHYTIAGPRPQVSMDEIQALAKVGTHLTQAKVAQQEVQYQPPRVPYEERHQDLMPALQRPQAGSATSATSPPHNCSVARQQELLPNHSARPSLSVATKGPVVTAPGNQHHGLLDPFYTPDFENVDFQLYDSFISQNGGSFMNDRPNDVDTAENTKEDHAVDSPMSRFHGVENGEQFFEFRPRMTSDLSYTSSSGNGSPTIGHARVSPPSQDTHGQYDPADKKAVASAPRMSFDQSRAQTSAAEPLRRMKNQNFTLEGLQAGSEAVGLTPRLSHSGTSANALSTFSISDYLDDDEQGSVPPMPSNYDQPEPDAKAESELSTRDQSTGLSAPSGMRRQVGQEYPVSRIPDSRSSVSARSTVTGGFRHAALVTSKWLSFGRVLFSPIHEEAKVGQDVRILILDGLGKEWSYYCALNYPSCQFYHLGPEPSAAVNDSVPNYRHIPHSSPTAAFPFPRGFFAGAVLRFPKISSDEGYRACISEIKRTLRPGGYLEMSTIDMDLMNMGNIGRKSVRDFKMRIHEVDSRLSLWNQGDSFLTILGRKGFEGIQRCVVALPVAGRISKSQDSTTSGGNQHHQANTAGQISAQEELDDPSLFDLLRNNDVDAQQDEQITKTVAKVGRWWYSTCYEEPTTIPAATQAQSIWETPGLLHEGERRGTSLRFLICYAQKPIWSKRRTVSV
ncbi:hypothetical protein AAFC00_001362 [Neodothiora populina]